MAGQSHLLNELRPQLVALDDDALATLGSIGLLRRARKDLETLVPVILDSGLSLEVELGAQRVTFDARGPARATCTCRATSTCQHVLAAWLHLRSVAARSAESQEAVPAAALAGEPAPTDLAAQLMAISAEQLVQFAGIAGVREAVADVMASDLPVIRIDGQLRISLRHPPVELRYAGGGLEAFVVDYRGKQKAKLVVRAVLAFQKANGAWPPQLPPPTSRRHRSTSTANSREVVPARLLDRILQSLGECVQIGIPHLSESMAERLLAQSVVAEGAGLHRLSLALSRLANHVDLQLGMNAGTSSPAFLGELAHTFALASAIRSSRTIVPALWGTARSEYEDVNHLELIGVAAEPWRTESGYSGLTLLLWSPEQSRWYSATDSRPAGLLGFDPVMRYRASGPWSGCQSPAAACGAYVTLSRARVNQAGRISTSEATRAQLASAASWPEFKGFEYSSWDDLRRAHRTSARGVGLEDIDVHAAYVVLRPRDWLEATFDGNTQRLYRDVVDESGKTVALSLKYSALLDHGIERLESARPTAGTRVVGQVERADDDLRVRPIALLKASGACSTDNLLLDDSPATTVAEKLVGRLRGLMKGGAGERASDPPTRRLTTTEQHLASLEREILRLAERGLTGQREETRRLVQVEESLKAAGLGLLPEAALDSPQRLAARVLQLFFCLTAVRQLSQ
jgi:hypothetical protein